MNTGPFSSSLFAMKKKVGRRVSKQSTCLVCGDLARIINYGALCCQACKTFFRRNASNNTNVRIDLKSRFEKDF